MVGIVLKIVIITSLVVVGRGSIIFVAIGESRKQHHHYRLIPVVDIDTERDTSKDDEFSGSTIISPIDGP